MLTQSIKKYLSTWHSNPSAVEKTFYITSTCVAYLTTLIYTNVITSNLITPDSAMLFKTIILFLKVMLIVGIYAICPHAWLYLLTLDHESTNLLAGKKKAIYHFPNNNQIKFRPAFCGRLCQVYFISITIYLSIAWLCKFGTFEEYMIILQTLWSTVILLRSIAQTHYVKSKMPMLTPIFTLAHATCAVGFFLYAMLINVYSLINVKTLQLSNFMIMLLYITISTSQLLFNRKFSYHYPLLKFIIGGTSLIYIILLFNLADKKNMAIKKYEDMYISISACNILKLNGYNANCNAHPNFALLKNINVVSQDSQQIIFKYNDNKSIEHEYSLPISEVKSRQIKTQQPHTNLVISNI